MKPDSTRGVIVAAVRRAGATWVDHEGRKGAPDGIIGYRGRMWWVEIKNAWRDPGACTCTSADASKCVRCGDRKCDCSGHTGSGNNGRTTLHAQLAWREAWQGPTVQVWTSVDDALTALGLGERRAA